MNTIRKQVIHFLVLILATFFYMQNAVARQCTCFPDKVTCKFHTLQSHPQVFAETEVSTCPLSSTITIQDATTATQPSETIVSEQEQSREEVETHSAQQETAPPPTIFDAWDTALILRGYLDTSGDDNFLYGRLQTDVWKGHLFSPEKENLRLRPFVEVYYNGETDEMERIDAGFDLVWEAHRFITLSAGLQYAHLDFNTSTSPVERKQALLFDAPDTLEFIPAFEFHIPMQWKLIKPMPMELYIRNDFTYNLKLNRNTYNEISGGLRLQWNKHLNIELGWRHDDITHSHDSDALLLGVMISF